MTEQSISSIFRSIAQNNIWGSKESISGTGSTLTVTKALREKLPRLLSYFHICTLTDAPCGDFNWMRHLDYRFDKYTGVDIVPEIITHLQKETFPPEYSFRVADFTADILPAADALLCRDGLVHLPFDHIHRALHLWKQSGFQYIVVTTFPDISGNEDCAIGQWRPLNMQKAPFSWPPPRAILHEDANLPPPYSKALGLWALYGTEIT